MEDERFDELTRSLADRVSRRGMLKMLVATAVGGILVRSQSGRVLADNSDCAHFCNANFAGEDRGDCKSDGAHGTGLCHSPCGPEGRGGTLCGGPAYASTTCCATGSSVCLNNACCTPTTCAALGATCGQVPDGCGRTLSCGACAASQCLTCAENNTCISTCTPPKTCVNGTCTTVCTHLQAPCSVGANNCCDTDGGTFCKPSDCFPGTVCAREQGFSCTENCDCRNSLVCSGGVCVRPPACAAGTVPLNGGCATPCTYPTGSTCPSVCGCYLNSGGGGDAFCSTGAGNYNLCSTDADCPAGQFCGGGRCVQVC
jgi:hypothetical protein